MKVIKHLVKDIREELEDAEKYAKAAMHYKDHDMELARAFHDLARQELAHSEILHTQAVREINAKRAEGVEPPTAMQAVWDWEHEKMIEETAEIRQMLDMFAR